MYSQISTFPIYSYNASFYCTRYDDVLYYILTQNGMSFLERYTCRSKWFPNQELRQLKVKRQKITVFVTLAPMYSVLLETSVSQFSWSLRSTENVCA